MAYTKKMAAENREMLAAAKILLTRGKSAAAVVSILRGDFPSVTLRRIKDRVEQADRELYGEVIREKRGGPNRGQGRPPGITRHHLNVTVDLKTIARLKELSRLTGKPRGQLIDGWVKQVAQELNLE